MLKKVFSGVVMALTALFIFNLAATSIGQPHVLSVSERLNLGCIEDLSVSLTQDPGESSCEHPVVYTALSDLGDNILLLLAVLWIIQIVLWVVAPTDPKVLVLRDENELGDGT